MTNEKDLQIQQAEKQEITKGDVERTRERRAYVPRVDIYETEDIIVLLADMPGVDENSVDITLDKNVLTIDGYADPMEPEDYNLAYAEYGVGDFQRSFTLSNEVDQAKIEATLKDGVLRLDLPKVSAAQAKKITVKAK